VICRALPGVRHYWNFRVGGRVYQTGLRSDVEENGNSLTAADEINARPRANEHVEAGYELD
jgi:hypothetical protein